MRCGIALFFIASITIASCRIEKRHYMRGYHVEFFSRHEKNAPLEKQEDPTSYSINEPIKGNTIAAVESTSPEIAWEEKNISVSHKENISFKKKDPIYQEEKSYQSAAVEKEEARNITAEIHPAAAGSFLMGLLSALCFVMLFVTSFSPLPLVIALCLGILVFAFFAKRLSARAFDDMYHARNRYSGKAFAAAGLALGVISVVALIGIIAVMLFGIAFITLS